MNYEFLPIKYLQLISYLCEKIRDMENDPELQSKAKYLGTISKDFAVVSDTIKEAAYQMRIRKISDYPIFPVSKIDLPIGSLLIHKQELDLKWNYNISFLDEFVQRQLVTSEHIEDFKRNYKNPDEFACLFIVDQDFTNLLFIPYPED